jgi:hypothetical protein
MSTITTTAVARYQPVMTGPEQSTLLGFLARYRGFTREAYALDLRQFTAWRWQHDRRLFDVRRVDIECFARDLEDRGVDGPRAPRGPWGCAARGVGLRGEGAVERIVRASGHDIGREVGLDVLVEP